MSPHLAGERPPRAACATLALSKRMKECSNGWKASCMLKRPDWWLAITQLSHLLKAQCAGYTNSLPAVLQRKKQVHLSHSYCKGVIERGEVNILSLPISLYLFLYILLSFLSSWCV